MTVAQVVGYTRTVTSTDTTVTFTFSNVTAGNWLILTVMVRSSATRTFTAADDKGNGAYTVQPCQTGACDGAILYVKALTSGTTVTTVTISSAGVNWGGAGYEVNGLDPSPWAGKTQFDDADYSDASHYCADTPDAVTTADPVFVCCHGHTTSSAGVTDVDPGATYSEVPNLVDLHILCQYKVSPSGLSAERGPWSSDGTERAAWSFMGVFKGLPSADALIATVYEYEGD